MADDAAAHEAQIEFELDQDEHETSEEREARRSYYPSNTPEAPVVNAISGHPYPFKVGSLESLRLFHVTDATGQCDERGLVCPRSGRGNPEPNHLYFESPEQYQRFLGRGPRFDTAFCEAWRSKVNALFPEGAHLGHTAEALASIRSAHKERMREQRERALARDARQQAAVAAAEQQKEEERQRADDRLAIFALNKAKARALHRAEKAAALKVRSQKRSAAYKVRRAAKRAARAEEVARKIAKASKKAARRRAHAAKKAAERQPAVLQRTYSSCESRSPGAFQ